MPPADAALILSKIRPDLQDMKPYLSARSLVSDESQYIHLDANEAPFAPLPAYLHGNRYPAQQPYALLEALAAVYQLHPEQLLISRGADEAIDLLLRLFGQAGSDCMLYCPPTFPMYSHSAKIQGVEARAVPLLKTSYQLDLPALRQQLQQDNCRLAFFCSPNNPSGNLLDRQDILALVAHYPATVFVVDETYFEYALASCELAGEPSPSSLIGELDNYANLVVLRTLSKSHACAGLRCGLALAHSSIIRWLRNISAPYPLPQPTIDTVLKVLQQTNLERLQRQRLLLIQQRNRIISALEQQRTALGVVEIFPSMTNFVLVRWQDSDSIVKRCRQRGIILRDFNQQPGLQGCVRISAGSVEEVDALLAALQGQPQAASGRIAKLQRRTNETAIELEVNLDRPNQLDIDTGIAFYDHMLEQLAKHGRFSLRLHCIGDLNIDAHHTIEDCAVALGQALRLALGDKRGIERYGFLLPMDEAQAQACLDLSGRFSLVFAANFNSPAVGGFPTQMVQHFFYSLAENLAANLHLEVRGSNDHHQIEALFKACGRVLAQAIAVDGDEIPSTKGIL